MQTQPLTPAEPLGLLHPLQLLETMKHPHQQAEFSQTPSLPVLDSPITTKVIEEREQFAKSIAAFCDCV